MTESDIRKNLFKYLNNYFPSLTPIAEEKHVKYEKQYCFVDILAKDKENNLVIIELKKSNAAAREAIHELIKYTEFVKKTYAANDDEIKLIVISTEWRELLIPFSKFCFSNKLFEIKGLKLDVDSNGAYVQHTEITPIQIINERIFSPEHFYCFYDNSESLENGLKSFNEVMTAKNCPDYVLFVLKRPDNSDYHHEHQYIIYAAMLRKTLNEYENTLSELDPTGEASYLARSGSFNSDSLSSYEKSLNLTYPFPESDGILERGKPLYLDMLLFHEGWDLIRIQKNGRLDNDYLVDESIIEEVLGFTGNGDVIYRQRLLSSDKRKLEKVKSSIKRIFSNNNLWLKQFKSILDDLEDDENDIQIEVYNPTNILLSIYQQKTFVQDEAKTSLPFFHINVLNNNTSYSGVLTWKKTKEYLFAEVLRMFYSENALDKEKGFYMCSQRNHIIMNDEILKYLNLEYHTLKVSGDELFTYYNGVFKSMSNPLITINDFLLEEQSFCTEVIDEFQKNTFTI